MNRVYIKTYGCQMNERDSEAVAMKLRNRGYVMVDSESDADIILLNTCSVRDQAEQKAIGKAGHIASRMRKNPQFVLGIMGCMAQNRGQDLLDRLPDLDLIVGTQKFHLVPDHLDSIVTALKARGPKPSTVIDLESEAGSEDTIREHIPEKIKATAYVSIMQGCNMLCTYCIVPKTRGRERYRPMESIIQEIQSLAASGVKEITLLGQIVNNYGIGKIKSVNGKTPFVQLLEKINDVKGIERIRFTSPHPRGFRRDLIEAYRDLPKLCEMIHLPMQSGSDRILRAMKRPYTNASYRRLMDEVRNMVPGMYFSTDVIVGFSGETDEDFEATRKLFEDGQFDMGYIFKYSVRSTTFAAENMADDVPEEVKEERNQTLLKILGKSSLARNKSLIGSTQEVLVEAPARRGENQMMGRTRGHRKTIFPGKPDLIGKMARVTIEKATVSILTGTQAP